MGCDGADDANPEGHENLCSEERGGGQAPAEEEGLQQVMSADVIYLYVGMQGGLKVCGALSVFVQ